jgi:hypothetical protein
MAGGSKARGGPGLRILALGLFVQAAVSLLPGPTASAGFIDPLGDTFGTGPVRHDIIAYDAVSLGGSTTFSVDFAGPIAPPSSGLPEGVTGFIDIDRDRDPATGTPPMINQLMPQVPPPPIALGDEFLVDLFSEAFHAGSVDVIDTISGTIAFTVPIAYTATGLSLTVPVVGPGNGSVNFGLVVGTSLEPTDRAPNGAVAATSTAVPEPGGLTLLGIGLLGCLACGWRRRSR